jgi:hypothetical protein
MIRQRAAPRTAAWLPRLRAGQERGSIGLYFAIVTVAAVVVAGMVLDGGAVLATRERAADLATQAARAGADALEPASVRSGPTRLLADPAAAQQAAARLLAAAGADGEVTVTGDTVTVRATVHRRTAILSAFGVQDISQSVTATATPLYGDTTQKGGG